MIKQEEREVYPMPSVTLRTYFYPYISGMDDLGL